MAIASDADITAAVNRAINPTTLTFVHYPEYTWCEFTKSTSTAKVEFWDGWAKWIGIGVNSKGTGWLAGAHDFVRTEFPGLGIIYLECHPASAQMVADLKALAPWQDVTGGLRWTSVGGIYP